MPKSAGGLTLHAQLWAMHAIGWMGLHREYPIARGGQVLEQVPSKFSLKVMLPFSDRGIGTGTGGSIQSSRQGQDVSRVC